MTRLLSQRKGYAIIWESVCTSEDYKTFEKVYAPGMASVGKLENSA